MTTSDEIYGSPATTPAAEVAVVVAQSLQSNLSKGGSGSDGSVDEKDLDDPTRLGNHIDDRDHIAQARFASAAEGLAAAKAAGEKFRWLGFYQFCGSSLMAIIAYLDPGNLEADVALGANAGFSLLWFLAFSNLVLGFCFQTLAGQLGLITGEDLATHCGGAWPKGSNILLWILIEVSIIAADIQETIGAAIGLNILSQRTIPLYAGCLITSFASYVLLFLDKLGWRWIEAVYAVLVGLEGVAMLVNAIQAKPPPLLVVKGFIPKISGSNVQFAVGALGALVMPYNIFFQSHVINLRPRDTGTDAKKRVILQYMRLESFVSLFIAFLINLFVVVVFAEGFRSHNTDSNGNQIYDPNDIGIQSADYFLAEVYGEVYRYFWAVGLLAAGQVSTLCLTYAGQMIMMGLLNIKVGSFARMSATRLIALVPTLTLAVVFETTNIFDNVAQIINILQSMLLPFGLIPIIHFTANTELMGEKWVNKKWLTYFASIVVVAVLGVNGYLLMTIPGGDNPVTGAPMPGNAGVMTGFACILVFYYSLALYFAVGPLRWPGLLKRAKVSAHKTFVWVKTHRRWADIESMVEVHH